MSSLRVSVPSVKRDDRRWILLVVALGWFVVIGVRLTIPVVLPDVRAQFGVGNAGAGLGVTLIWLTYALRQFPAGVLVDRLGERRVIVASLLIAAASLVAFSLTPLYVLFLAVCTMFGFGTGLFGDAARFDLGFLFLAALTFGLVGIYALFPQQSE
jgi:predicted MFS family arabinose efflux permease